MAQLALIQAQGGLRRIHLLLVGAGVGRGHLPLLGQRRLRRLHLRRRRGGLRAGRRRLGTRLPLLGRRQRRLRRRKARLGRRQPLPRRPSRHPGERLASVDSLPGSDVDGGHPAAGIEAQPQVPGRLQRARRRHGRQHRAPGHQRGLRRSARTAGAHRRIRNHSHHDDSHGKRPVNPKTPAPDSQILANPLSSTAPHVHDVHGDIFGPAR